MLKKFVQAMENMELVDEWRQENKSNFALLFVGKGSPLERCIAIVG